MLLQLSNVGKLVNELGQVIVGYHTLLFLNSGLKAITMTFSCQRQQDSEAKLKSVILFHRFIYLFSFFFPVTCNYIRLNIANIPKEIKMIFFLHETN